MQGTRTGTPHEITAELNIPMTQRTHGQKKETDTAEEKEKESPRKLTRRGVDNSDSAEPGRLLKSLENIDPAPKDFLNRTDDNIVSAYKDIYNEKKKQTKQAAMDVFLKRENTSQEEPWPGGRRTTILSREDRTVPGVLLPLKTLQDKMWRWKMAIS